VFREVVPISDTSVRAKIHQTYRMGYLKDVILPRWASPWEPQCPGAGAEATGCAVASPLNMQAAVRLFCRSFVLSRSSE